MCERVPNTSHTHTRTELQGRHLLLNTRLQRGQAIKLFPATPPPFDPLHLHIHSSSPLLDKAGGRATDNTGVALQSKNNYPAKLSPASAPLYTKTERDAVLSYV